MKKGSTRREDIGIINICAVSVRGRPGRSEERDGQQYNGSRKLLPASNDAETIQTENPDRKSARRQPTCITP